MKGRKTKVGQSEKYHYVIAIVAILALLINGNTLPAQTLIDPVSGSATSYTAINSDYGPRNISSGTNPHIGIDYHLPQGGKAYAVAGGTIQNICLSCNTPYIQIGNWRYIHMYTGETQNQFWHATTITLVNGSTVPVILLRDNVGGALLTIRALAAANPGTTITDPITQTMLNLQNSVSAGDWVFVSDALNHLHIDYSPDGLPGWENPLKYIRHLDNSAPVSSIHTQRIINNSALTITDSVQYGYPFIICSESNVVTEKDLDQVSLYASYESSAKQIIRTWRYAQHGLQGVPIIVKSTQSGILAAADSGIYPAPGLVSLDFHKHHFYSRARQDGATAFCNLEAKYPDGYHTLELVTSDVTSHSHILTRKIILDNFKPFIRSVTITTDKLLYAATAYWNPSANELGWMIQSTGGHFATGFADAQVNITTSEPMKSMTVSLSTGQVQAWGMMQAQNPERTEWAATIPQSVLFAAIQGGALGFQPLVFNGTDRAGNTLFVPNYPGTTPAYLIPHRHNDGSWSVPGSKAVDNIHGFYLKQGPSGNVIDAEFVTSQSLGTSPLLVQFTDASSGNPVQYQWNFGNGSASTSKVPPAVEYFNSGSSPVNYSVSLKVKDASGNESTEYKVNHITVFPAGNTFYPEASFTFVQYGLGAPSYVSFVNQSAGSQLSYYWDFDDGATSTSFSPSHIFSSPGYYDVRLTVTDKDGYTDTEERTVFVYPAIPGNVNVYFTVKEPATAGEFVKFNDLTSGVPMAARRLWDFGDGVQVEVLGIPMHLYYVPGSYQVRLEVRDYLDNLLGVYCRMVTIIPNALHNLNTDFNQLKAPDGATGDAFGHAVAVNGDWIFVGAPYDDDHGNQSGSVYVFKLNADSTYAFVQKITPKSGKAYDYFGCSVSSDGPWMVAGAYQNANYGNGRVWFFEYDGTQWVERQQITCPTANRYFFGWSVRMKGDRSIIGAPGEPAKSAGMAVIYRKSGSQWVQEATLSQNITGVDHFGACVAIDGVHAMVSLRPASGDKIRFYRYDGVTWQLLAEKNVADVKSIAMECPQAAVGDTWNDRVILYRYTGTTWVIDGELSPEDGVSNTDDFGRDVAIAGKYLMVGAPGDITTGKATGSAYLFRKNFYGQWIQYTKLMPDDGDADERFGHAVSLSHSHALAGAYAWKSWRGSVYTYPYITDPCDRVIRICHDVLSGGEIRQGESGTLVMGGLGCHLVFEPGSTASYLSKTSTLQEGFHALEGSEVTITAVDCYSSSAKSVPKCTCLEDLPSPHNPKSPPPVQIQVYPNPAKEHAQVSWTADSDEAEIRVYSHDGRLWFRQYHHGKEIILHTKAWPVGLYFVEVNLGAVVLHGRLLKGI